MEKFPSETTKYSSLQWKLTMLSTNQEAQGDVFTMHNKHVQCRVFHYSLIIVVWFIVCNVLWCPFISSYVIVSVVLVDKFYVLNYMSFWFFVFFLESLKRCLYWGKQLLVIWIEIAEGFLSFFPFGLNFMWFWNLGSFHHPGEAS